MNNTILEKKKRVSDQILYALIQLSSFLSIFILLVIIGYILYRGIPAFDFSYLVNTTSIINDTVGILPNIINTLYIVIVTLLIACPIGIGGAIYLNEYTKNKKSDGQLFFCASRRRARTGFSPVSPAGSDIIISYGNKKIQTNGTIVTYHAPASIHFMQTAPILSFPGTRRRMPVHRGSAAPLSYALFRAVLPPQAKTSCLLFLQ